MKPALMVFDGDCGFCRAGIARWRRHTGTAVDYAPYQEVASQFPQISREAFSQAVYLIEQDGRTSRAAEAVVRALELGGRPFAARVYRASGISRAILEAAYRWVAAHRTWLGRRLGLEACERRTSIGGTA